MKSAIFNILKAMRNGVVYGGKIRFSHAVVISLLYRSGPLKEKLAHILRATKNHATVLAMFAFIYKTFTYILTEKTTNLSVGSIKFVAGGVAAYFVYAHQFDFFNKAITHQITLYCFSRVVIAVGKVLVDVILENNDPSVKFYGSGMMRSYNNLTMEQKIKFKHNIYRKSWKWFAMLVWASVMFLYDYKPQYLQSSLRSSMKYIYDTEQESWDGLRGFLGI